MKALATLATLLPLSAFAQDAADAGVDVLVTDLSTVAHAATTAGNGGVTGTALLIVASLVLVTRLLTKFGKLLPGAVGLWFATPIATWILPMVLSVGGALITALGSGQAVSVGLIMGAVLAALGAGGFGSVPAKLQQINKAETAGQLAAAGVTSKAEVVSVLAKGPPVP